MLRTSELDFALPPELIATTPAEPRDAARLLVVSRSDATLLEHRTVRDLPRYLRRSDLMVVNNTRVLPARFVGRRVGTGGKLPGLYLGPAQSPGTAESRRWQVLIKGGHLRAGVRVLLGENAELELLDRSTDEPGAWIAALHGPTPDESDQAVLMRVGMTPLPPYILAARKARGVDVPDAFDRERYQTTFAEREAASHGGSGSVAAPTAGLHLTPELLHQLEQQGVERAEVTLHVGTGTFKPVETEFVEQHPIHAEHCAMPVGTTDAIQKTRAGSGRVFAVGTTAARVIETYGNLAVAGQPLPESLDTRIFITPGYRWQWVDGMLTNFHLPQSTLLAMVGSLFDATGGLAHVKEVYATAIRERYRFFSYGDAMLILP
ncbi:MAG TPA: tRNA preQ1(34) S-adenosylmethionine ribosyltransferase-isomerase QueA [Phycisphaerales bacterium]|nr:tRNA preQ1(34) S-adenosylmethionine ribosyltransferase-isomerase QueA [Phycisphaerales bacterium]